MGIDKGKMKSSIKLNYLEENMKHVIAFDVSMGKSYVVIFNSLKKCIFEGEIKHIKPEFVKLRERINELIEGYEEQPNIVFESTGVYSRPLERFMQENNYSYCVLNPLDAKKNNVIP
jgi:transposase